MKDILKEFALSKKEFLVILALVSIGITLVLFLGSQQLNSLNRNPLPTGNKAAQEQCLADLRAQNVDVSGAKSLVCQGK